MGTLRVGCGQYRTQLVVAWSPTEAGSLAEVQRLAADPYFHRRLPLDELSSHALQAGALLADAARSGVEGLEATAAAVLAKNRRNGARAYPDAPGLASAPGAPGLAGTGDAPDAPGASGMAARWPLPAGMVAAPVTGAVALVLASEAYVRERGIAEVAWIAGLGWATEPSFLGDRDLAHAPALQEAARQAYGQAGLTEPLGAVEVAELSDATPYQELLAYEALGLAPRAA